MSTLFELLPIGAYRSSVSGRMLRANIALVRLNGYDNEIDMLAGVNDISLEWYVDPQRRQEFRAVMERDGKVVNFVSEIYWHKSRRRCWIREFAHVVFDSKGHILCYEGTVEDINDSYNAEAALIESETLFREMSSAVPGMLYRLAYSRAGTEKYLYVSTGVRDLYGLDPEDVLQDSSLLRGMRHPLDQQRVANEVLLAIKNQSALDIEFRIVMADGTQKWVQMRSTFADSGVGGDVSNGIVLDITARKLAQTLLLESEDRWKLALESAGDGIWDWFVQTGDEFFSKRCKEIFGFVEDELPDRCDALDGRTHPDDLPKMLLDREAHFRGETLTYSNEHRIRCKDGQWKWVLSRGMVINRDADGQPVRMIGTHTDISDRKSDEALIWSQAHFDPLTGLPNRRLLRDRLLGALRHQPGAQPSVAVLFIDLDHFKEVNDTLGHDSGDLLLIQAAQRIQACLGPHDTVARMGGDEFTVVITDAPQRSSLEQVLQKMLKQLSTAFQLRTEQVFVSASIGVAMYPQDASQVEDLFKHADQALYVAKGAGRNRYSFFTPELQEAAQIRLRLAADLRLALPAGQFELAYQPIVDLLTGHVIKAEALLRWRHPQRGLISPADFISIAESTGLIIDIGEWVFRQAATQAQIWRQKLSPDFQISVNKSPVQFQAAPPEPWDKVLACLELNGNSIAVEITEGLLLDATDSVMARLKELRDADIEISLDDFGTGYSSLTYLQRFPIDNIKIDRSYVCNLVPGSADLALCKAIITMAHELGMRVVAEGIETVEQCLLLTNAGCDMGQGYLFAKPMPSAEFESFFSMHMPFSDAA